MKNCAVVEAIVDIGKKIFDSLGCFVAVKLKGNGAKRGGHFYVGHVYCSWVVGFRARILHLLSGQCDAENYSGGVKTNF